MRYQTASNRFAHMSDCASLIRTNDNTMQYNTVKETSTNKKRLDNVSHGIQQIRPHMSDYVPLISYTHARGGTGVLMCVGACLWRWVGGRERGSKGGREGGGERFCQCYCYYY